MNHRLQWTKRLFREGGVPQLLAPPHPPPPPPPLPPPPPPCQRTSTHDSRVNNSFGVRMQTVGDRACFLKRKAVSQQSAKDRIKLRRQPLRLRELSVLNLLPRGNIFYHHRTLSNVFQMMFSGGRCKLTSCNGVSTCFVERMPQRAQSRVALPHPRLRDYLNAMNRPHSTIFDAVAAASDV